METPYPVGEAELAAWCDAWNDGDGACCRARPPTCATRRPPSELVERFAAGPRARPTAVGAVRRHFAFRQDTRAGARPARAPGVRAARASEARCSSIYWPARARSAPRSSGPTLREGDRGLGRPRRPPLPCKKLNVIAFSCWNWIAQLPPPTPAPPSVRWRPSRAGSEQEAWRLEPDAARRSRHQRAIRAGDVRSLARASARRPGLRSREQCS